jgi:hypothetical protein
VQLGDYYIERRTAILVGILALVVIGAVLKFTVFNGSSSSSTATVPMVTTPTTPGQTTPATTPGQTTPVQTTPGQTTPATTPTTPGQTTPATTPGQTTPAQTTPALTNRPAPLQPRGINGVVQGQIYSTHCTGKGKARKCKAAPLSKATVTLRGLRPPARGKTLHTKTNSRGFYQLQLPPGIYMVSVSGRRGPLTQINIFPHQLYYAPPLVVVR